MTTITLSPEEILTAVIVGARRLIVSQQKDLSPTNGCHRGWDIEIEGALAEEALAKHLGAWFDPNTGKYKSKDVGEFHVRQTAHEDGCLILRPTDPEGRYILIVGSLGTYRIAGWIDSQDAKKDRYRKAPNGRPAAWFVPQSALKELRL